MKKLLFLACALLLGASHHALAQGDPWFWGLLIDPPLYVTNQSGAPVDLAWQTSVPGSALSPPRKASIAVGAQGQRIEPGLFWIVKDEGDGEVLADNIVYLSTLNGAGGYAEQIAVHADVFNTLANVKKAALDVTIDANGGISVAPRLDK